MTTEPAAAETRRLRAVVARLTQMADHWEQKLPEVIRTPAVVSAIRATLETDPSAVSVVPPATNQTAPVDRAAVLREAIARVEDPEERAKSTIGLGLGWESAREVLRRMLTEGGSCVAAEAPQPGTPDARAVAYSDGKGRVFCLACLRPDAVDVPVTVEGLDPWELCPSCGQHVVDVARDQAPAVVAQPGKEHGRG